MKTTLLLALLLTLTACSKSPFPPPYSDKHVFVSLVNVRGEGDGSSISTNQGETSGGSTSKGSMAATHQTYHIIKPTKDGFVLAYDITITRKATAEPQRYEGQLDVLFSKPAKKSIDSDYILSVKLE
jgi:hypothetical protein